MSGVGENSASGAAVDVGGVEDEEQHAGRRVARPDPPPRYPTRVLLLLACQTDLAAPVTLASDAAPVERVPGTGDEDDDDPSDLDVYADTGILSFGIELDQAAIDTLAAAPTTYVTGTFTFRDERHEGVGVRLKGNSTYQWLDGKPAWKVKFDESDVGARFHGLERLTLDSNYWDGSQMAETLAYRVWREADAPAPRTGYARVTFNGEPYGLYTIVEAMDDDFVRRWWPDSGGGLYEMGRTCDFDADCSCYEIQETGPNFDPDGLGHACAAAASGDATEIRAHWDWERFVRFQAVERVVNHPDTYSYNLNNYFVYHDPLTDRVTLTPWGADSTFSYAYPPNEPKPCQPGIFDDLAGSPSGYMAQWCMADATCLADVRTSMLEVADQLEQRDLAGRVDQTAARIRDAVAEEPRWPWGIETFESQVDCFRTWITDRPAQVRAWATGG